MIKISRTEAYSGLSEMDLKVINQELDSTWNSDQRNGRDMDIQYFLENEKTIVLKVYWDKREVSLYRFNNQVTLTETAREKLEHKDDYVLSYTKNKKTLI